MNAVSTEKLLSVRTLLEKGNGTAGVIVSVIGRIYDHSRRQVEWHVELSAPHTLSMVSKSRMRLNRNGWIQDERVFTKVPLARNPEEAVEMFWDRWVLELDRDTDLALAVGQPFMDGPGEFSRHVYRRHYATGEWVLQ